MSAPRRRSGPVVEDEARAAAAQAQGRSFYVSVRDGDRYGLLAGPFETYAVALGWVPAVRELAGRVDDRAHWYAFGTCSADTVAPGLLNARLGLPVPGQ